MSEAPEAPDTEFEDVPEEPEDSEEGQREVFLPPYMRRRNTEATTADRPLTNADPIPLLPNATKKMGRVAVAIKVFKLDPPNHGFKGEIPISSDQAYIASQWGDGVYNLEFVNEKREVLRRLDGLRIAVGFTPKGAEPEASDSIEAQRMALTADNQREARLDRIHREVLDRTTSLADKHTQMVMDSAERMSTREQSFFTAMLESARTDATTERERSRQAHEQEMERLRLQHDQQMERERATNQLILQQTVQLARLAASTGGGDSEPTEPWVKAVEHGVTGLKHLRDIAVVSRGRKLLRGQKRAALPAGATNGGGEAAAGADNTPQIPAKTPARSEKAKEIAREVGNLARACAKRGIDIREVLRNAVPADAPESPGENGVGP